MLDFSIKPDAKSIAKSKMKFVYLGVLLLIINFYFIAQYFKLMLDGQSFGYYLFVLSLVNLPIFVVSIVLLLVPTMHKKYYENVNYVFKDDVLELPKQSINVAEITIIDAVEFVNGTYKVYVYLKSDDNIYELQGINGEDWLKINEWFEKKKV